MLTRLIQNKWYLLASLLACYVVYAVYLRNFQASTAVYPLIIGMTLLLLALPSKKELACLMTLLVGGLAFAVVTPVLNTPDEYVHLSRAMHIAQGDINLDNKPEHLVISEDYFVIIDDYLRPPLVVDAFHHPSSEQLVPFNGLADFRTTNAYWFIGYIPQVSGILIGRALGLSVGLTYYLGRIINAICYALLAYLAIKLSGPFKQLMILVTLMPMNIFLAASFNQDGLALGIIYVVIGLFIHYLTREKAIAYQDIVIYTTLCCLLVTLKLPYILLIGLLFFIPRERFSFSRPFWSSLIATSVVLLLATVWFVSYQQIKSPTILEGVGLGGQLEFFFKNTDQAILTLSKEFFLTPHRLITLFYFGLLNLPMKETLVLMFAYYMFILASNLGQGGTKLMSRIGSILISLAIICGIIVVMYLTWTEIGKGQVDGIQGRYYLGVLPLLAISLCSWPISNLKLPRLSDNFVIKSSFIILTMVLVFTVLTSY